MSYGRNDPALPQDKSNGARCIGSCMLCVVCTAARALGACFSFFKISVCKVALQCLLSSSTRGWTPLVLSYNFNLF